MMRRRQLYFTSLLFISLSITLMLGVKYKSVVLHKKIANIESQIKKCDYESRILKAEWAYLTTPERLLALSETYLEGNSVLVASQIKEIDTLRPYYTAKSRNLNNHSFAFNEK